MKPQILFITVTLNITFYIFSTSSFAQDVHFSQTCMTPLVLNPALTGVYEGDHRVSLNYKNQWQGMGMHGAAYNTALFSYDSHLFKKKWSKGYLGAGINAYRDVAGDLKMGTTQLNVSVSGIVFINENQLVSGGIQAGYVQKSISAAAMQWDSQYDQSTGAFNSSLPSNDVAFVPPVGYGDFSTGLSWYFSKSESSMAENNQLKINLGLAAFNINTPNQNFISGNTDQLHAKFVVHCSTLIGIKNTNFALTPNFALFKQGSSYELNMGSLVRLTIKDEAKYTRYVKEMALSLGAQYRMKDAIIPMMLFEYANYAIGISYDITTSSLVQGTHGRGGLEVSLRFLSPNPFRHSSARLLD